MWGNWVTEIWTILTTASWFLIIATVVALAIVVVVEFLTWNKPSLLAKICSALVTTLIVPIVFYGIQRTVEAPERDAQSRRDEKFMEDMTYIKASIGNPEAANELIELRARALFAPSTGDAERFVNDFLAQLPKKKGQFKTLQDDSAKEAMRLRLDWEPFFHAFLKQFDQRVAALQSRNMVTDFSSSEIVLVQPGSRPVGVVRYVRTTGGYELRVRVFTGRIDFGQLTSDTWVELLGMGGGETDKYLMKIHFNINSIGWELITGSNNRGGSVAISRDSQARDSQIEEYHQGIKDGLNFAFEYAILATAQ